MEAIQAYRECTDALGDFAGKIGFTDCVIGLSGGMDSALVAVMCVDAFGADHVHAYMMPGPYSTGHSVDDARELASNLGIDAQIISILEPFEAFERVLSKPCKGEFTGLASDNTQARCRMVCLMALSNKYGWMMVNTGNKSEAMMGYSTLYGHMTHYVVSAGQYVSQGQVIGYVGSTGLSTGPHLHFTIFYNGSTVNPAAYI